MTPSQITTLRAACFADPTAAAMIAAGDAAGLCVYLNTASAQSAWNSAAPVFGIVDAIDWSKYTPSGAVDDSTLTDALVTARRQTQLLAIQTKQMNLQLMLQGRETINATKPTLRLGLRDAVTAVPAGSNGGTVNPGGSNASTALAACMRPATHAERMLASSSQTTGASTALILTFEGYVSELEAGKIVFRDEGGVWTP